jgi:sugar lactone lactonase YvrE
MRKRMCRALTVFAIAAVLLGGCDAILPPGSGMSGMITTVAGLTAPGYWGDDGPAISALITYPVGLSLDTEGTLYISDSKNYRIRKVNRDGIISTVVGAGRGYSGDNGQAYGAGLDYPCGVVIDSIGKIYIADRYNNVIRMVDIDGIITTIAGDGSQGYSGDGGRAVDAQLFSPFGLSLDTNGSLYIAENGNHCIRKVDENGIISTVAGNGMRGYSGDDEPAISAMLQDITGVVVDKAGSIYIADSGNHRIRKVDTAGIISTVAGNGIEGFSGDNGPATAAQISYPDGVAVDLSGNLYIAEYGNNCIRKVDILGIITTVSGKGTEGFSGDNGPAISAQLNHPVAVAVDSSGNLYISDYYNCRVRKVWK